MFAFNKRNKNLNMHQLVYIMLQFLIYNIYTTFDLLKIGQFGQDVVDLMNLLGYKHSRISAKMCVSLFSILITTK